MKSHTKSRRGCVQCKHRKVKCDETLPCCDRCRRRHEHCSYLDEVYGSPAAAAAAVASNNGHNDASRTTANSGLVTTPGSSSGSTMGHGGTSSSQTAPYSAGPSLPSSSAHGTFTAAHPGRLGLDTSGSGSMSVSQSPAAATPLLGPAVVDPSDGYMVDMELLHFYLTSTYKTLWGRTEGKLVWRDVIFREALTHPPLMNGLLTTAALHRIVTLSAAGHSQAAAFYHSVALHKQRQALEGLVILLRSLDPDSCRAIFPLSMMVSFWAFASRLVPEELGILTTLDVNGAIHPPHGNSPEGSGPSHLPMVKSSLDLFIELIRRIRAVQTIAQESISWLTQSQFLPLMAVPEYDKLPPLPEGISRQIELLEAHIQRTPRIAALVDGMHHQYSLKSMYQLSRSPDWLELVTGWVMSLPQTFVDELQRRNHAALTVFAYWLGCFYVLEDRWWAHGWTAALIVEIEQVVRGGEWAGLVEWLRMYLSIIK